MSKNEIKIEVTTDDNNVPETIEWYASAEDKSSAAKATMISIWDEKEQNTLRIDLWNKDMTIDEMKKFFHQTLLTMSDTYVRATNDKKLSEDMKDFCHYFGVRSGILKDENN